MTAISIDEFLGYTTQWAGYRNDSFKYYWPVKGGWEGWAQVDLVASLLRVDSRYDILREQHVFVNPQMRVDILLNATLPPSDQVLVELKAESMQYNRTPFVNGVSADIDKLSRDRSPTYSASPCIDLTIAFNPGTVDQLLSITRDGHRIFALLSVAEVALCAAVWTHGHWVQPHLVVPQEAVGEPTAFSGEPAAST